MDDRVKAIVRGSILRIINENVTDQKVQQLFAKHETKVHFVPIPYRVLGGLLQSLNIKFGNFLEELLGLVVENDNSVEALADSGKKIRLSITAQTDSMIDSYITSRQLPDSSDQCDDQFHELLEAIVRTETTSSSKKQTTTKDVDALFRNKRDGRIVYVEIKYNDDHDTGKFVDINRKFLKTYAGLVNRLNVQRVSDFVPILYYFNPTKRYGPIYTPSSNIYRGAQLFEEFFETRYDEIDAYLQSIGDDEEILAIFDDLYRKIRRS